ncbi:MAG: hypothetical protein ACLU1W_11550, partial [Collinsella sp.]
MGQAFAANAIVTAIYHVTSRSANHLPITHVNVQEATAETVATADAGKDLCFRDFLLRFGFFQVLGLGAAAYQRAR